MTLRTAVFKTFAPGDSPMKTTHALLMLAVGLSLSVAASRADNPLIMDQFTADPTARVFEGKIYLYPSHDIVPPAGVPRGFCMEDYHAFSSENLLDWTDHGVIVD